MKKYFSILLIFCGLKIKEFFMLFRIPAMWVVRSAKKIPKLRHFYENCNNGDLLEPLFLVAGITTLPFTIPLWFGSNNADILLLNKIFMPVGFWVVLCLIIGFGLYSYGKIIEIIKDNWAEAIRIHESRSK